VSILVTFVGCHSSRDATSSRVSPDSARSRRSPTFCSPIVGTGFLVGPATVATNRHVVDALTMGTGRLASGQAVIRFGQEFNVVPDPKAVAIVEVRALHPALDLALLRIEPVDPAPSPFVPRATAADAGTPVATIGYPAEDPRNPYFVGLLFGASLGV